MESVGEARGAGLGENGDHGGRRGLGLKLRVSLIVLPLVAAMLVLALMPIRSYLRLRVALADVRRELTGLLLWCRFDILAVGQSVDYFGVAFSGADPHDLDTLTKNGRRTLDRLRSRELTPRQTERLRGIEQAYVGMVEAGNRAIELARADERGEERLLAAETVARLRDGELLPGVDSSLIEGRLSLGKALDRLMATSSQLVRVPPIAGLEADANSLREKAAEAISVARLARQALRLVGTYRAFAYSGESWDELAAAEHDFDHAYMVWQSQVSARGGDRGAMSSDAMTDLGVEYRAMKAAVDKLARLDPVTERTEVLRIFRSELEPHADRALPQALTAAFDDYDAQTSSQLDSVSSQSRIGSAALVSVALLGLGLALVFPWLISRWIVRPVLAVTRAARELGAGAEGGSVTVRASGEVGELAASFNRMAEHLAERTRELEAERARERLRHAESLAAVGILASGLAHQINNPINNILLTAEHALGERGPDAARIWREALEASAEEAKRCERIVSGLVAFSRGEPGRKWREDANQVLRRARDLTADTAAERRATVELRTGPEPAPILANPIALEQALVNIIRNALQSRPRARVRLSAERVGSEPTGEAVRIEVRDDGRGLERAELDRLFDPFYTTRADEGGIGLGLSVAHRIIADHGGEIRVDSRLGEGTTVRVEIPLDLPVTASP